MGSSEGPIFFDLVDYSDGGAGGGRYEKELFEALEHSDRVPDEELGEGRRSGSKRNMDKREAVPTMKGKRQGFDLAGKGQCIVAGTWRGARHLGGRSTWEWQQS